MANTITTASRSSDLAHIDTISFKHTLQDATAIIVEPKEYNISIAHGGKKPRTKVIYIGNYEEILAILPLATVKALRDHMEQLHSSEQQKKSPPFNLNRKSYTSFHEHNFILD
ncbi:17063_t:CDS:2 [Dentiscutata erythropus]|uniref:17063_t:CDS:1 n=1 Tax=Dentiscutata erythropus TaxID=1348616 RepID=A0A9N9ATI3_9GLOM|nr:17063_t:CDS:2 [Dentiscutata erythropus]